MRRAARTDGNQADIVSALRQCGASVQVLSAVGAGCPDLLVGYHGMALLMECKSEDGKPTPEQVVWHRAWTGHVAVVRSVDEAIRELNRAVKAR